jgi:hypothetical protein
MPANWDLEADVVVIGAGATGVPAAIKAADGGRMTSLIQPASADGHPGRVVGMTAQSTPRVLPGATTPLQSYRSAGNIDSTQAQVSIRATGTRCNYFVWDVHCPIFPLVRATGLTVKNWQDLILVNQLGQRFYDETKGDYAHGSASNDITPYTPNDYRNTARLKYDPTTYNFFNAAAAMNTASEPPDYAEGPIWAIFDADAVAREGWQVTPPYVDPDGYWFSANTLAALAAAERPTA